MARGINIKIATVKVIKALETNLEKIKKDFAEQDVKHKKYTKVLRDWEKKALEYLIKNNKGDIYKDISFYNDIVNVSFKYNKSDIEKTIGEMPTKDYVEKATWKYNEEVEEIENAIRLLKLTDEEFVSTSTYKSIAKYI
jgi:hypothetical protein